MSKGKSKFRTEEEKRQEKLQVMNGISMILQLGILMTAAIFIGVFIGIYLDKLAKTSYLYTLIFSLLGIMAAFRNMYMYTIKKGENDEEQKRK